MMTQGQGQGQGQDPNQNQDPPRNSGGSPGSQSCAACKHRRGKCQPDCPLRPFFPASHHQDFQNAQKLFGFKNLKEVAKSMDPNREFIMSSLIYEANVRAADPVGGCRRKIIELEAQVKQLQEQLGHCQSELLNRQNLIEYLLAQNPNFASQINVNNSNVVGVQNQFNGNLNLDQYSHGRKHNFSAPVRIDHNQASSSSGLQNELNLNVNCGKFRAQNSNFSAPPTMVNNGETSSSGLQNELNVDINLGNFRAQNPNLSAPITRLNNVESSSSRVQINELNRNMNLGYFRGQNPNFSARRGFNSEACSSRIQYELDVNMNVGYFHDQNPNISARTRFVNEASSCSGVQNELNGNTNLDGGNHAPPLLNLFENNMTKEGINPNSDGNLNAHAHANENVNDLNVGVQNELNADVNLDGEVSSSAPKKSEEAIKEGLKLKVAEDLSPRDQTGLR